MNNKTQISILYVVEEDLSRDDGPGINEREFVSALLNTKEINITCLAPYPKYREKYYDKRIYYIPAHHNNPIKYLFFIISSILKIGRLNKQYNYDALVFRMGTIPIAAFLAPVFFKKPLFLKTFAGLAYFEDKHKGIKKKLMMFIAKPVYRATIKRVIYADSPGYTYKKWQTNFFKISKSVIEVIPNNVNIEKFNILNKASCKNKLGFTDYNKIIGYVGAMSYERHVSDLIYAFAKIADTNEDFFLVLVGKGKDTDKLKKLAISLGLKERVLFVGFVSYEEVPIYMNCFDIGADLSIIPMRIGNNIIYGSYSQKIPQYLSCGLPVITWDTLDTKYIKENKIGAIAQKDVKNSLLKSFNMVIEEINFENNAINKRAREYAVNNFSSVSLVSKRVKSWQKKIKELSSKKMEI